MENKQGLLTTTFSKIALDRRWTENKSYSTSFEMISTIQSAYAEETAATICTCKKQKN